MTRHIRKAFACTVAMLVLSTTAAVAQEAKPKGQLPSQAAAEVQTKRAVEDHVGRVKQGLPPKTNETDCDEALKPEKMKAAKDKGFKSVGCRRPTTPPADAVQRALAQTGQDVPIAQFSEPTGTGEFQANGLRNATADDVPLISEACYYVGNVGLTTISRTKACILYAYIHEIKRIPDGAPLGGALVIEIMWEDLNPRSRSWDMYHLTYLHTTWGAGDLGLFMFMWGGCPEPCKVVANEPENAWAVLDPGMVLIGKTRMSSNVGVMDYSHQAVGMLSASKLPNTTWALGIAGPFMEVRCDAHPDLVTFAGQGCVYHAFAGGLRLSASDQVIGEAARFYRDAQQYLVTHPGARGWQPLSRAYAWENAANRAISRPVCDRLPKKDGQSCDEYPFAATQQGAAFGNQGVTWDVRAVNAKANSMVGTLLSIMYGAQRIAPGDIFYVDIVD